jgi:hypothetical protein
MIAPRVRADELADFIAATTLELDDDGVPRFGLAFVELGPVGGLESFGRAVERSNIVLVGVAPDGITADGLEAANVLDLTLAADAAPHQRSLVAPGDLDAAMAALEQSAATNPRAGVTLAGLLRATAVLPVASGLVAESMAYSMLLAGAEFARWRAMRPVRASAPPREPAVLVRRDGDVLDIRINRPERHNAFDRFVRDGLVEAFDLALADPSIVGIQLTGSGPSFCSGGDLDEFGASTDVTTAHLVRLDRSVAARVHRRCADIHVLVHGACIGAGIEIPSFAGHVSAAPDAFFQLPEIGMGLVPGAGGTVGITRRIGRWRTAYLALTGARVGRQLALEWGLVDACVD